jgi:serine/threonine protein kinase
VLSPGDVVRGLRGVYRVEAVHGQGSFGVTYRAVHTGSNERVILKELRVEKLSDWKALELFQREGEVLRTLSHPHIPAFRDFFAHGADEPLPFSALGTYEGPHVLSLVLVQELIAGGTLEARLRDRPLEPAEAERILLHLLDALRHLHEHAPPLIHRDVKPGNIILTPDGRPYLVDFGAIQTRIHSAGSVGSTIVGTLGYMPLEQIRGDARTGSDLYALGMTMVVALSGTAVEALPFDDSTGKVALERALPDGVSPRLREAIGSMVEPMVGRRAHSATEVVALLEKRPDTHMAAHRSPPPPPASLRPSGQEPEPEREPPSPPSREAGARKRTADRVTLVVGAAILGLGGVAVALRLRTSPGMPEMLPDAQAYFTRHFACTNGPPQARSRPDLRAIDYSGSAGDQVVEVTGCGHDVLFTCGPGRSSVTCTSDWQERAAASVSPSASVRGVKDAGAPAPVADLVTGPFTVTWAGRLDASTGLAPAVGSPCSLAVTMAVYRGTIERQRIVLACKGETLFDSKTAVGGDSTRDFVPTESLVDENDDGQMVYAYRLKASDIGTRLGPQIAFDTGKQTLDVWRDTTSPFRVHGVLDRLSSSRSGKPASASTRVLFPKVVRRSARVTAKTGKVPFSAPTCRLRIAPAWYATSNCRVSLDCGGTTVYGDGVTGLRKCALHQSEPVGLLDPDPTPVDGSPELTFGLDVASATLADAPKGGARYSVSFSLEPLEGDASR